jgi:hypothetical protein
MPYLMLRVSDRNYSINYPTAATKYERTFDYKTIWLRIAFYYFFTVYHIHTIFPMVTLPLIDWTKKWLLIIWWTNYIIKKRNRLYHNNKKKHLMKRTQYLQLIVSQHHLETGILYLLVIVHLTQIIYTTDVHQYNKYNWQNSRHTGTINKLVYNITTFTFLTFWDPHKFIAFCALSYRFDHIFSFQVRYSWLWNPTTSALIKFKTRGPMGPRSLT